MNNIKNEQGYTLLIVLLVITIMFPMGGLLIRANLNSTRQFQHSEEYRSAVAMAEMGVEYAKAKVESLKQTRFPIILESVSSEEEAFAALANEIETVFSTLSPVEYGTNSNPQSYLIHINERLVRIEESGLYFTLYSTGSTGLDYLISTDFFVASPNLSELFEGGSGGEDEDFRDPDRIPEPRSYFPDFHEVSNNISQTVNNDPNLHPSDTIMVNANDTLFINGSVFSRNFNVAGAERVEIANSLYATSGAFNMTGANTVIIGEHLGGDLAPTITDTNLTVGGDVAFQNSLTFQNSIALLGTPPADCDLYSSNPTRECAPIVSTNRLHVEEGSYVSVFDTRPSELFVRDSRMTIRGSLLTGWSAGEISNSTLLILGHVDGDAGIALANGSTVIVNGNARFPGWSSIIFRGTGSRFIVFGELTSNTDFPVEVDEVETLADCPVDPGENIICQILYEEPSSSTLPPPTEPPSTEEPTIPLPPSINPDEVIWETNISNIQYQGIQ